MKAIVIHEHGGPEKLSYEYVNDPKPSRNEVLVKVKTCALNHLDIWARRGLPGKTIKFPHILGCDISGEIASKNKSFPVGTRVMVYPGLSCGRCTYCKKGQENLCARFSIIGGFSDIQGGYAEYVKVPLRNIMKIPSWLTFDESACLGVSYLTSWNMLKSAGVGRGTSLLVYGAASGVGSAAIKLARAMDATIITTVGDEGKVAQAKRIGADHVIERKKHDIVTEVMTITGNGVDVVIDHVGPDTWMTSIRCLKPGGKMAVCGATTGEMANVEVRAVYNKQLSIMGAYLGTKKQLAELISFMKARRVKTVIDSRFKLSEAAKAHVRMENSDHFGKILLSIGD
jgi:NADPH:quinone reductase-like Zn-dependent oxidoreductase